MLSNYVNPFRKHVQRAGMESFKPLTFDKFVSLAKHLEAINASEKSK